MDANNFVGPSGSGYTNIQADALLQQVAYQQAMVAYQNAQLEFQRHQFDHLSAWQKEQLALQRAQDAWNKTYQEASLTGYYKGAATIEREQMNNQTTQNYLNLLASLRGPADYFQYLKVLNSTPQGLRDLVNAAAGKYSMSGYGGANPTATTEAASIQSLLKDVASGGQQRLTGLIAPETNAQTMQQVLPSPSQWNAANYNRMTPTQQSLLKAYYESQGWRPEDVEALFRASLPKYTGPTMATIGMG